MTFSRVSPPSSVKGCENPCKAAKASDDQLSTAVQKRIKSLTGKGEPATGHVPTDGAPVLMRGDATPCQRRASTLGPILRRFNLYREALPYARAASDMNHLGDEPKPPKTTEPKQPKGPCLTRLPVNAAGLCRALGLPPNTIKDKGLRNDKTGFRATMYRDEDTGQLILVARDTQPTSLVDWQTNMRNAEGLDTEQYQAMRKLASRLRDQNVRFNLAGYSKGGGEALEAALVNPYSKVFVFNSAGVSDAALKRTGNRDFKSLEARTTAFSAQDDFLSYMNETTDPLQQIENVKFLRRELEGENRIGIDPMKIDHRNPEQPNGKGDPNFDSDLKLFLQEFDGKVTQLVADQAAGKPIKAFPSVHAGHFEKLPGASLGSKTYGPNLGKLAQHQMKNVLEPMEATTLKDRIALKEFLAQCG